MTEQLVKRRLRRCFSDKFKREAVNLLRGSDAMTAEVSSELQISYSVLSRWAIFSCY